MARITGLYRTILLSSCVSASTLILAGAAHAQAVYCPPTVAGNAGLALAGGFCTNGVTGAFSNAAVGGQALSDVSQNTTQSMTNTAGNALASRRETEQQRCPSGTRRVGGTCQPVGGGATERPAAPRTGGAERAPERRTVTRPPVDRREPRIAEPIYKAPYVEEPPVRYATWAQGFGDYERRTGTGTSTADASLGIIGGIAVPLFLTAESRSTMGGVLGGADVTIRRFGGDSGFIFGLLGGYTSTDVRLNNSSVSSNQAAVGNGFSSMTAHLKGGSAGAYATYFYNQFSAEASFRADFLDLDQSFTDLLSFSAIGGGAPTFATVSGSGSTRLNNYTTVGNLNYRVPLTAMTWIEPTVGVQYTQSDYDASAAALGLANGHLLRIQGGARYGSEFLWNSTYVTATLTGLLYDNVDVSGGFIQNVAFGQTAVLLNDEGKLRGQGILAFKFDYGGGMSTFLQGEVRGGQDLFGAGGKGGVRYEW